MIGELMNHLWQSTLFAAVGGYQRRLHDQQKNPGGKHRAVDVNE
jgi:hypothetical protein